MTKRARERRYSADIGVTDAHGLVTKSIAGVDDPATRRASSVERG